MILMKKLVSLLALIVALLTPAALIAEATAPTYTAGTYTAEAKGYGGAIIATVTIDEAGAIADVKLVGEQESPYVGGYSLLDYPAMIIKAQSTDIEAYSGATFTNDGIIAAVEDCLAQASSGVTAAAAGYKAGVYTAESKGYGGAIIATVTIDEAGSIADVKLVGDQESPYVGGYSLLDYPAMIIKAQSTDIEAYSGATFTNDGIIAAVEDCLAQAAQ